MWINRIWFMNIGQSRILHFVRKCNKIMPIDSLLIKWHFVGENVPLDSSTVNLAQDVRQYSWTSYRYSWSSLVESIKMCCLMVFHLLLWKLWWRKQWQFVNIWFIGHQMRYLKHLTYLNINRSFIDLRIKITLITHIPTYVGKLSIPVKLNDA